MTKRRVLIVGPGRDCRGGITTYIKRLEQMPFWQAAECEWLETLARGGAGTKLWAGLKALVKAPFAMRDKSVVHIHVAARRTSMLRKSLFVWMAKLMRK